MLHLIAIKDY